MLAFCEVNCYCPTPKPVKYPKALITIGDHLTKRRLDLKLYQAEVAQLIGVSEDTITYWENGRTMPQIASLPAIIDFLGYIPYNIDVSTLGGKIKQYRLIRGLSRRKLAKQLGVDASTILMWEDNRIVPNKENYEKLILCLKA